MSKAPKLRFKEFSGDWESKKIGDTLKIKHGKDQKKVQVENGIYPILATGGEIGRTNIPLYSEESVLIGRKGTIDRPFYMNTPFWTVDTLFYSEIKKDMYPKFIYYKFQNINWKKYCEASGVPSLSASTIEGIKYNIPSIEEQEKIASFFSLIDDKISLQGEKVEALKDYKKGMMQKIFSRELRFKDDKGRDYPEWEDTELKEMIALTIDNRGKTPPTVQNGIPLLEVNSLGGIYPDFKQINKFVDEETYNEWFRNHIQEGDLLFTTVGATGLVSLANSTKSCIAQNIVGFRFKEGYTSKFMYNLFNYRETMKRIKAIEMGAVQPSIKVTQLIKLKFSIPSIDEQIKIGKILSSIDLKIEKEQEKLDSLNEYKKGLLQQMFV